MNWLFIMTALAAIHSAHGTDLDSNNNVAIGVTTDVDRHWYRMRRS